MKLPDKFDQILVATQQQRAAALEILFANMAEPYRSSHIQNILQKQSTTQLSLAGLMVAVDGNKIVDCLWAQLLEGRSAVLSFSGIGESEVSSDRTKKLVQAADHLLKEENVVLAQALISNQQVVVADALLTAGFHHEIDLNYMVSVLPQISKDEPSDDIEFISYRPEDQPRLAKVVQQTYQETLDCPGLDGLRDIDDVLAGYRTTGDHDPSRWFILHHQAEDVGCLLLADHRQEQHWELIYMGIIPKVRGRGWGYKIVRHAQQLAHAASRERLVLAVDASNAPAMNMYLAANFTIWDSRAVYIKQY